MQIGSNQRNGLPTKVNGNKFAEQTDTMVDATGKVVA